MNIETLLEPRIQVISDYPGSPHLVGDILPGEWRKEYAAIFRAVNWWEHRTLEQLRAIKYMKVVEYVGYWVVGDVVPVQSMKIEGGILMGFYLTNHLHPPSAVKPATQKQYEEFLKREQ
jgi:hypothetical protein